MKYIIILMLTLSTTNLFAIRSVGNGGGESEMKLLMYIDHITTWFKICTSGSVECISNIQSNELLRLSNKYNQLNVNTVRFVSQKDFKQPIENLINGKKMIIFSNEELYVNNKKPLNDRELFSVVLNRLLKVNQMNQKILSSQIHLLPKIKNHTFLKVAVITGEKQDFIISNVSAENLTQKLKVKYGLKAYKILSENINGYTILNLITSEKLDVSLVLVNSIWNIKLTSTDDNFN